MISRRSALSGACKILLATAVPAFMNACARTEAENIAYAFPNEIPGAAKIQKYHMPGARYCLVHIRQRHITPFNPNNLVDKLHGDHIPSMRELELVNKHQKVIYDILERLRALGIIGAVYIEGMTSRLWDRITKKGLLEGIISPDNENLEREIRMLEGAARRKVIWEEEIPKGSTAEEVIKSREKNLEAKRAELRAFRDRYKYAYGGELRLVYEGKLKPGFEDESALEQAEKELNATGKPGVAVYDRREDALLEIISGQGSPLAVVPFGGFHAWGGKKSCGEGYDMSERESGKDNLFEWNRLHPDKKFSLIEVVPDFH